MNKELSWYNFSTGQYDWREAPTTDEEDIQYLPYALGADPNLYKLLREHEELSVLEAMIRVLSIAVGEKDQDNDNR